MKTDPPHQGIISWHFRTLKIKRRSKSLREKITKNQSPAKDWKPEGLSFSPSTLEARRQGVQPSLF